MRVACRGAKPDGLRPHEAWCSPGLEMVIPSGHKSGSNLKLMTTRPNLQGAWGFLVGQLDSIKNCGVTRLSHTIVMGGTVLEDRSYLWVSSFLVIQDLLDESSAFG